jgi:hypothetical protein
MVQLANCYKVVVRQDFAIHLSDVLVQSGPVVQLHNLAEEASHSPLGSGGFLPRRVGVLNWRIWEIEVFRDSANHVHLIRQLCVPR